MPRQTKRVQFAGEQRQILDKIFNIINCTESNNTFYLSDLIADVDKQQHIYDLIPDIKKYYKSKTWTCLDVCNESNIVNP